MNAEESKDLGEEIYRMRCAVCHGAQGQGTEKNHPQPFAQDLSLSELREFISKSMPPDAEQKCTGDEAAKVADYIVRQFYSPDAQLRQPRPRLSFNHLTATQYRNAIADLMASFRGGTSSSQEFGGLQGSYNTIAANGDGKHVMTRVDPEIHFDFGKGSPDPEKIDPREFSIIWQGSVRAPVTGEYEFIVRSGNSVRLWVNDRVQPLIDGWIKSGDAKEYRATVRLLGGRSYPTLLQFTKAGQGVAKPADQKAKEEIAPSGIGLFWIPPGRSEQAVPRQFLSPHHRAELYIVETAFPPDDRSTGFERGSAVSKEWDQATTDSALEIADYVLQRLRDLTGGAEPGAEYEQRLRQFCGQFAERAFRRPLNDDQKSLYINRHFDGQPDLEAAVQKTVLMTLKSPRFLYPGIEQKRMDSYYRASQLSLAMWDSPPDEALLKAAAEGALENRDQLASHAERMSRDPRCRYKLREFLLQWMKLDQVREFKKSTEQFPGFDSEIARDLRLSLELFLEEIIASESCDYRQLFLAQSVPLNGRLSRIYGGNLPEDAAFQPLVIDGGIRAGLLTHPYLMSVFADSTTSSPIRRGVFLARGVLGRALMPPPDAFVPLAPSLHPDLNTRERVVLQTSEKSCQSCHGMINPLGFTLGHFDAIGRFQPEEGKRPIDATGEYTSRRGTTVKFDGARQLAAYMAESDEAHSAIVDKLFHFAVQQPVRAYGNATSSQLKNVFKESQFNLRRLVLEIGVISASGPSE